MKTNSIYLATVSCTWLLAALDGVLSMSDVLSNRNGAASRYSRDSGRRRMCSPREVDDEDPSEHCRIRQCCRKYGDDYYDITEDRWRRRRRREDDYDDEEEESGFYRRRKRFWRRLCRRYRRRYEDSVDQDLSPKRKIKTGEGDEEWEAKPAVRTTAKGSWCSSTTPRTTTKPKTDVDEEDDEESETKPTERTTAKGSWWSSTTPRMTTKPKTDVDEEDDEDQSPQSDASFDTGKVTPALSKGTATSGTSTSTTTKRSQATTKPVSFSTARPASTTQCAGSSRLCGNVEDAEDA